jgi:predicted nucleotidyltransferase
MAVLSPTELKATLEEVARRLRESLAPVAIYLFGSYAYGTPQSHSDLDILVVVEASNESVFQRDARAYRALRGIGMPKDVMVYTREEFELRASLPVSFERTVKQKGQLLYAA